MPNEINCIRHCQKQTTLYLCVVQLFNFVWNNKFEVSSVVLSYASSSKVAIELKRKRTEWAKRTKAQYMTCLWELYGLSLLDNNWFMYDALVSIETMAHSTPVSVNTTNHCSTMLTLRASERKEVLDEASGWNCIAALLIISILYVYGALLAYIVYSIHVWLVFKAAYFRRRTMAHRCNGLHLRRRFCLHILSIKFVLGDSHTLPRFSLNVFHFFQVVVTV